jgi:hypothetical protein
MSLWKTEKLENNIKIDRKERGFGDIVALV